MKNIFKGFSFIIAAAIMFAGCKKTDKLPYYAKGTAPVLSADVTSFSPAPEDSDKVALTLSWSNPHYAIDSSTVKYIIQVDSTGKDFSNAVTSTITGTTIDSIQAKQFNNMLLSLGFTFGVSYSVDIRIVSSYANNNDQAISNTITLQATPYKNPPKVQLPSSGELYIVGDATQGGWNNPVPEPAQKFEQMDETTWIGVFNLIGGKEYLLLPLNGSWDHKYSVADKTISGLNEGGVFGYDLSNNIPGPTNSGWYKITVNFQDGIFKVEPYAGSVPDNLFIVGSATNGSWNNPVPIPDQQFTKLSSTQFELTLPMIGGQEYLFLPTNGDWTHKFAATPDVDKTGGVFQADAGANFPGPSDNGTYKVVVDFINDSYTVTQQ